MTLELFDAWDAVDTTSRDDPALSRPGEPNISAATAAADIQPTNISASPKATDIQPANIPATSVAAPNIQQAPPAAAPPTLSSTPLSPPGAPPEPPPKPPPPEARPSTAAERARAAYQGAAVPPRPVPAGFAPPPPPAAPLPPPPLPARGDPFPDPQPLIPPSPIDADRLAELEALTPEIHLVSAELGDVFLVRAHTGRRHERVELTFGEAATLRRLVDQFPGARVVELRPSPPPSPAAEGWDA